MRDQDVPRVLIWTRRFDALSSFSAALFCNSFNLAEVVQVVSREHSYDMRDGFFSPLLMHSVVLPKIIWHRFQKRQVVLAQYSERFQRGLGIALGVVKSFCPGILVERL